MDEYNSRNPQAGLESEAQLELFKTGLRVVDGELQRLNKLGGIVMRLPLRQIDMVEFQSRLDPFCLVFITVGIGLGAIGHYVSENNVLTALLYAAGIILVGFGLLGSITRLIQIRSSGCTTTIQCSDMVDEGEGFVCSLQALIGSAGSKGLT